MGENFNIPQSLIDEQLAASNPSQSAWVSANAGSGKTYVLTQRVIRLMLAGNEPDRILCLTFTKAAAANMKNRVFETLSRWAMMEENQLRAEIRSFTGQDPSAKSLSFARQLFARALDTPGGLKVQTIHAFCESLLHQFPLEANIAGSFSVISDTKREEMITAARVSAFSNSTIRKAYSELAPLVSDNAIHEALTETIMMRSEFRNWLEASETLERAIESLLPVLGIKKSDNPDTIWDECFEAVRGMGGYLNSVEEIARNSGKKTDHELAAAISVFLADGTTQTRLEALAQAVLKKSGEPKAERSLATNTVKAHFPNLVEVLYGIADKLVSAHEKINALNLVNISKSLFTIASHVVDAYEAEKSSMGLLDFDDLIQKSVTLLHRTEIRDWIRFRLDRGIDHMLVDEAQDTSPAQWKIINAVIDDFHAGEGASPYERTVFAVGDEKQSIYSFQGADPREFAEQHSKLEKAVARTGKQLKNAKLDLSFRSTKDILHSVDRVFEDAFNATGLTQSGELLPHDAVRSADPGEVQVWPVYGKPGATKSESWLDPIDHQSENEPTVMLAKRIAETVREWVGKPLPGTGVPLKYGDILVLVRKRDRFITALTRTMKDMEVPVAGADRLRLLEHIATEDLLSAGKFVLLEHDDLNLACLLKSILLDLDDSELLKLAPNREDNSLYEAIEAAVQDTGHPGHDIALRVLPELAKIRSFGRKLTPFGFYAWLLGSYGGRRKMLGRLGMEAEDVLDAFMDELLEFSSDGGSSLETFITQLESTNPEIKRELELDRDEVRILTVHASKGLEARCVFLVDSCGEAWSANHRPRLLRLESSSEAAPFLWVPRTDLQIPAAEQKISELKEAAEGEYRRLLYVGMTRAADRLVVCGYHGRREPKHPHWHQMVHDALEPSSTLLPDYLGQEGGFRWTSQNISREREAVGVEKTGFERSHETPEWLFRNATKEPEPPRHLSPSGAFALIDDGMKENRKPGFESAGQHPEWILDRGTVTHHLLEVLPAIAPDKRQDYATRYIAAHGSSWPEAIRLSTAETALGIIVDPDHEWLFSSESLTEVPVIGSVTTRSGIKRVSGQIDRLIVNEREIVIVDYKTNRIIPEALSDTPVAYITQLALYKHLIGQIYPKHEIRCGLLWTTGPKFVELPSDLTDKAISAVNNG